MNRKNLLDKMVLLVATAILLPLSLFAQYRPQDGTNFGGGNVYNVRSRQLDGVVQAIRAGGREIVLSTTYGTQVITVNGRTKLYDRARGYRASDLNRGDRVRVNLAGNYRRLQATSIEVLQSVRDGYGRYPGNDPGYYDRGNASTINGVVTQIDRWSGLVQLTSDAGQRFRVDTRSARSDLGQLRAGDRVTIRGTMQRDVFRATDISFNRGYGSYDNRQYGHDGNDGQDRDHGEDRH